MTLHAPAIPSGASPALCLDFDGTLVEIADRPDAVVVPHDLPRRLARLHKDLGGALVIVSGRAVVDILRYLPDFPGLIIGAHGAETGTREAPPTHSDPRAPGMHRAAQRFAQNHPALLVEDKPHGVVLHYRAAPDLEETARKFMADLCDSHDDMALQPAKMAFELRPAGATKDRALARALDAATFAGRLPVYAGDDATDEPAMALCQSRGGLGIKIGNGDTVAQSRLPDPAALARWLDGPTFIGMMAEDH